MDSGKFYFPLFFLLLQNIYWTMQPFQLREADLAYPADIHT